MMELEAGVLVWLLISKATSVKENLYKIECEKVDL